MNFTQKFGTYLNAAYPIIGIETHEENRVIDAIQSIVEQRDTCRLYTWDVVSGLVDMTDPEQPIGINGSGNNDPIKMLSEIAGNSEEAVFVLKDLHQYFNNGLVVRKLRSLIPALLSHVDKNEKGVRQTLVLLSPRLNLPYELQKDVQMLDFALPTKTELLVMLGKYITNSIASKSGYKGFKLSVSDCESIVEAAAGMTSTEFENALSFCSIVQNKQDGKITMTGDFAKLIFDEKIINLKNGLLEYVPNTPAFDEIGGLTPVKDWALLRRQGYEEGARALRLPYPKGVLVAGFRGCGKTTLAMAISKAFGFPMFKLDVGKVFGSRVGESEGNIRELIRLLEGLGRAVILIDEIEKYFNTGAVSGQGDSGTSSRVFGTLVSWMATKKCPIFLIGTANNIDALPPELIRRGRFDEVWWVDLPNTAERVDIFNALLGYRFGNSLRLQVNDSIIKDTEDFTGAEIEGLIEDALYNVLTSENKDLRHWLKLMVAETKPQAKIDTVYVDQMRKKAKAGFKLANTSEKSTAGTKIPRRNIHV